MKTGVRDYYELSEGGDSEADPIHETQDKTRHSATVSCAASFHPQMCCCRPVNQHYLISHISFNFWDNKCPLT